MTYVMFPVRDGVVIDGRAVAADYSARSQDEARADVLAACTDATGTARAFAGDAARICPGSVAGEDLDVEWSR